MRIWPTVRAYLAAPVRRRLRREARRVLASTQTCQETQTRLLADLIALNAGSDFSRQFGLSAAMTPDEFRRQMPITRFDTYLPFVERLKQGHGYALLGTENRLLMFALTSGTTSESKFIPITQRFLDDYRRGWQVWGIHTYDDHPPLKFRHIVQFCSDYDQFRTEAGMPCGNISGLVSAIQNRAVKQLYKVPDIVTKITDHEAKYYAAVRLTMSDQNTGLVFTANPSTLVQVAKLTDEHKERLLRDLADGSLDATFEIDPSIRQKLRPRLKKAPRQFVRELEQSIEQSGHLYPKQFWPNLELLAVWTSGSAGVYLPMLRQYYGDVPIRDHGLSASEGRMTIPLADDQAAGVLDVCSHFFEFIPEEEYENDNPTVLWPHELQRDRNYYILLTTSSGLYRYDISDVVRCVGFSGTAPVLEFLHKGAHIANMAGEKVSESQMVTAVAYALRRQNLPSGHYIACPIWDDPPRYRLLLEEEQLDGADADRLAADVDERLQELNMEYRSKRTSKRLAALQCRIVPAGTWQRFSRDRQSCLGGSVEQYKHPFLVPDVDFHEKLLAQAPLNRTNG